MTYEASATLQNIPSHIIFNENSSLKNDSGIISLPLWNLKTASVAQYQMW